MISSEDRQSGRTTRMLKRAAAAAIELPSEVWPVCVICASDREVIRCAELACDILHAWGIASARHTRRDRISIRGGKEIRFYTPHDTRLPGRDFVDVFIDHYVWDVIDESTGRRIREIPTYR